MKLLAVTFERPDSTRYSASCNLREDTEITRDIAAQREGKVRSLAGQPDHRQNKIAGWRVIEDGVTTYARNILPGTVKVNDVSISETPAPVEPVRDHNKDIEEPQVGEQASDVIVNELEAAPVEADAGSQSDHTADEDDEPELEFGEAAGELGEVDTTGPSADAVGDADLDNNGVVSLDEMEVAGAPVKTVSPRKKK